MVLCARTHTSSTLFPVLHLMVCPLVCQTAFVFDTNWHVVAISSCLALAELAEAGAIIGPSDHHGSGVLVLGHSVPVGVLHFALSLCAQATVVTCGSVRGLFACGAWSTTEQTSFGLTCVALDEPYPTLRWGGGSVCVSCHMVRAPHLLP